MRIHILLHQINHTVKLRSSIFLVQYPKNVEATFVACMWLTCVHVKDLVNEEKNIKKNHFIIWLRGGGLGNT